MSKDKVVQVLRVFASGHVETDKPSAGHTDRKARAQGDRRTFVSREPRGWASGDGAAVSDSPAPAPAVKPKDPKKVAAGKARAAKAAAAKTAVKPKAKPAKKAPTKKAAKRASPFPTAAAKGGKRSNAGRKPKGDKAMEVIAFRGSAAQKRKLGKLGGAEWMRAKIDAATVRA